MLIISLTGVVPCRSVGLIMGRLTASLTPGAFCYAVMAALLAAVAGSMLFQAGVRHVGVTTAATFSLSKPLTGKSC